MLYAVYDVRSTTGEDAEPMPIDAQSPRRGSSIQEDEIDVFLEKQDGLIYRDRDLTLCQHNASSKCNNCLPVDPYDEDYLNKKEIKHMSFHSYLRKILGGAKGKSTATTCPLEKAVCKIKPGCVLHPPWPEGICSRCQPDAAITLNLQRYRHVDNISFENEFLVNRFLDYWRRSGQQRVGYLLGRYEPYFDVPLGIRAVVAAIYEPPQLSGENFVQLDDDPAEQQVDQLCAKLDIRRIGWVFTDLVADIQGSGTGSVKHTRHADTYLISAEECITAGYLQNCHPNICKYSSDGVFGSKFVTVVVSGGEDKQVHFFGYQVSNLCASLVDANCLFPTIDAPELAYVKESSSMQYVPDVYYKETDKYKNEVLKIGRPLPVEYLVVDVPAGMPKEPLFSFRAGTHFQPFAVENRIALHAQNLDTVRLYVSQFGINQIMEMMSDFHFLLFLLLNDFCRFTLEQLSPLLDAIRNHDRVKACDWAESCQQWKTLMLLIHENKMGSSQGEAREDEAAKSADGSWPCRHCTFVNDASRDDCEICGLPKGV